MSSTPPQISPDGRFYWDGAKWQPMATPAPPSGPQQVVVSGVVRPAPAKWRYWFWGIVFGAIMLVVVCSVAQGHSGPTHPKPVIDLTGREIHSSSVGADDSVLLEVTNKGPAFANLAIYLNGKDNWLKHHVVTDPGDCTLDKSLERLDCGPLAKGATRTFAIGSSPKDPGNFDFSASVVDVEGTDLVYPDLDSWTWNEAVTVRP